ncbi:F0F1 ATP synthase subunit delta [Pontibacterium granulatum]|uniref:F0F1 ATP synthase subunit delta n=1 Tax=Pontibacterium granulatum TaxID=2036029 RepID=UPI00249C627F|nr:F0F1 ATP synthase subunit delta [Pontibacterium granulatum]MDI3325632.1 F0F1 ATP synthase subunit delta [Pontibacterium granulatum]
MELNWSTFVLEIVNFLVLIWILQRFIYKPVLKIITQRRAEIEKQSADAQCLHEDATNLKKQYQNRLNDWDQERQLARDNLNKEIENERIRQLDELQRERVQEREKIKTAEERRYIETVREIEHQALRQGAQFAARLLNIASGPELETRLISLLIEELNALAPHKVSLLQEHWGEAPGSITVCSVYPISEGQKKLLETALAKTIGQTLPVNYTQEPELVAGLRITIGAWVLQTNVRDELKGFEEFARVAR